MSSVSGRAPYAVLNPETRTPNPYGVSRPPYWVA